MKKIIAGKILQKIVLISAITFMLNSNVMVVDAQGIPVGGSAEALEVETVSEELSVTETDYGIYYDGGTYKGLTWAVYNKATMLVITGSGAMSTEGESPAADSYPWYKYNVSIDTVEIGNDVTNVGMNAFSGMANLENVKLGSGITVIEKSSFSGCTSLKAIEIPASVKEIQYSSFSECSNLTTLTFASGSKLTTVGGSAFYKCTSLQSVVFPDNLVAIGSFCFYQCTGLKTITLGSKLETIDNDAFAWCPITVVDLPESIRTIGNYAFAYTTVQTIDFPYGLQTIGDNAFYNAKITGNLVIPGTVTSLGKSIFAANLGIKKAEIYASCDIGESMFDNCINLEEVIIGDQVTGIDSYAFSGGLSNLKKVTIGKKVSHIGREAFHECGMESIVIPDNVKSLSLETFSQCGNLVSVTIGTGITNIANSAFADCTALETVTMKGDVRNISWGAFRNCGALKTLNLPDTVEQIYQYAFENCDGLTNVTLPDPVTLILTGAFSNCDNLATVTVGSNVREIGADVFKDCPITKFTNYSERTVYSDNSVYSSSSNFTIYGWADSTTNTYADNNSITFVPLSLNTTAVTKLTNEAQGVHVYWNEVPYAKTYDVYRSTTKASGYTLIKSGVTTTDYADVTVKGGTTYFYKVVAVRDTRKSGYSAATHGITYLAAPTFKKVVNVVSGVHVYWNASSGAKTYNVYRSTSKASGYSLIKSGLTATHYIDTTAVSGTTYYYKIVAVNGSAKSGFSAPFNAITYVGTPDITSRFNKGAGVQLGWNKISGATGYAIYRKPYTGSTWTRVATIQGNTTFTWMDESVKTNNGTVYKYTIRALAGSDMKTLSGCRSTGRTMARLTSQTLSSAKKASSTSIKCNWTTTSVCNGYEVRFMVGDTVYKTYTVGNYKTGVKTFIGLKAGQTYKIQVRTYKKVSGVGTFYSAWSEAKYVKL